MPRVANHPGSRARRRGPPKRPRGPLRTLAIGALLALLGVVLLIIVTGQQAPTDASSYRRIDDLAYERAFVVRSRAGPSIHLGAADGGRYRLPEYVWPEGTGMAYLLGVLRADSVATVWVSEGRGYPVIKGIRTPRIFVDPEATVPLDRRRHAVASIVAPALLVAGLLVAGLGVRGLRARPPFRR